MEELVAADELGFHEAWIAEHLTRTTTGPDYIFDASEGHDVLSAVNPFIGKAAALTRHIRLGPGVRPLAWYQPLQVALEATVCDHLTRGRYMLGIGTGGYSNNQMEQRGIGDEIGGIDPSQRGALSDSERHARWHEAVDIVLKAWTATEPFDYSGRFYQGRRAFIRPAPYQAPHPPIAVACGFGRSTIEFTARRGFAPFFSHYTNTSALREMSDLYVSTAEAAGQHVSRADIRATRYVYVADSMAQARKHIEADVAREMTDLNTRFVVRAQFLSQADGGESMDLDALIDTGYLTVGDPDTVYRRLRQDIQQSGGYGVLLLVMGHGIGTVQQRTRSMALFMNEVAPRLNELPLESDHERGGQAVNAAYR
jgi:alkanesulfonate monooxygenase SsuD/methylene tetrahydromethanopterin reductase-like flavin-dependent oxidoreductase (luciferase family)